MAEDKDGSMEISEESAAVVLMKTPCRDEGWGGWRGRGVVRFWMYSEGRTIRTG